MEDNVLKQMSEDVLVIPFSDEIVEKLEEFSRTQLDYVGYERISELIICFVAKKHDERLLKDLVQYIELNECLWGLPVTVVEPIIAEYIVLLSINEAESDFERIIYSLMLKNSILLVVKGYGYLSYPKSVINTYNLYSNHLEETKTFESENTVNLINELLSIDIDKSSYSFSSKEKKMELKSIFYDAAVYRYNELLNHLTDQIIEDDIYLRVYKVVKSLIEETPWLYIDRHPERTLKTLICKLSPTDHRKKLGEVINLISKNEDFDEEYDATSVLLNMMAGEKEYYTHVWNNDAELTIAEFAVYMYYELLTEKLLEMAIEQKKKEEMKNAE